MTLSALWRNQTCDSQISSATPAEARNGDRNIQKRLWRGVLSKEWAPPRYTGKTSEDLSWDYQASRNTTTLDWKGQERTKWKKSDRLTFYRWQTVWWKYSGANIHDPSGKRKDDSKDRVLNLGVEPQTSEPRATECYFQVLKSKIFFPTGFQNCLASVTPLFLPLPHFWHGNVCNYYPVPSLCLKSR